MVTSNYVEEKCDEKDEYSQKYTTGKKLTTNENASSSKIETV